MAGYTLVNLKEVEDQGAHVRLRAQPRVAPDGAEVLAFGAPNTNGGDIEMKPGWWTD